MVESIVIGIVAAYLLIKFAKVAITLALIGLVCYGALIVSVM